MEERRIIGFFSRKAIFLSLFFVFSSCSTKEKTKEIDLPKINKVDQTRLNDVNILVDKQNKANFKTSIILNQDVSMFNTGVQETNQYMFVKKVDGENVDDIVLLGKQEDCFLVDRISQKYACTFDFEVLASQSWESKNIVREISSITYSIFDTEIISPVSIKIFETIESTELINSSKIFKNLEFKNLFSTNTNTNEFLIALNWDYLGFDTDIPDAEKMIHIKKLYFHFNQLKIENAFLIIDNFNGQELNPPREDELKGSNIDYKLTSEQAYWSGNFLRFYVSFDSDNTSYKQVSDFLEMEYSINESLESRNVLLSSIQLYDFLDK